MKSPIELKNLCTRAVAAAAMIASVFLAFNAAADCAAPPAGLVSWWRGESNALDQAGTNNGVLAGNTTFGPGRVGQAFVFDGSGDGVSVGNPASLQLQNFSIEAWIKRGSTALVSHDPYHSGIFFSFGWGGYGFAVYDDGRLFLTQNGSGQCFRPKHFRHELSSCGCD